MAYLLDQWQQRTKLAGASLLVLVTYTMHRRAHAETLLDFEKMVVARGIPVVDEVDYITRQGGDVNDARFKHDIHWTPQGHQWIAEALLEWMLANPHICAR